MNDNENSNISQPLRIIEFISGYNDNDILNIFNNEFNRSITNRCKFDECRENYLQN